MTPERLKALVDATGLPAHRAASMLGYASDNSLRQCIAGKQKLPSHKAAWLERYAEFRAKLVVSERRLREKSLAAEAEWLRQNPPPDAD